MIQVENKIISFDVFEKEFVCDLSVCKGACCVKGDAGAPLTWEEVDTISNNLDKIKPFMRPEMASLVEKKGIYYSLDDNEPLASLNQY